MRATHVLAITFLLFLLPAQADVAAQGDGAPPPRSVWTVFATVDAEVHDNYATVQVIADIGNRGPDPEFPFQVQIPEGAYVTGLTIVRDGTLHVATIEERAAARAAYDAHKAIEETGGLVEKQRGYNTYAYLINVAEFTSVRATLTYEQYVAPKDGIHSLALAAPVSGFGQDLGAAFRVAVDHTDGLLGAWSDNDGDVRYPEEGLAVLEKRVGPRPDDASTPFTAHYMIPGTTGAGTIVAFADASGDSASFVHRLRAPQQAESMPLDLVLVMDTSGSMSGQKIAQLKDSARQLIAGLDDDDRLHLTLFSSAARQPWSGMREADKQTRDQAIAAVDEIVAGGGTNIHDAIEAGFAAYEGGDAERVPIMIFLTDGLGRKSQDELRDLAVDRNDVSARVFGIAFGNDADWSLVAGLAQDGGGRAIRVAQGTGAEVDLADFMTALTAPVLRDIRVMYDGNVEHYRIGSDVLFAGSEVLIVGKMPASQETLTGQLQARDATGTTTYKFEVDIKENGPGWLPRLVAAQRIRMLEEFAGAGDETDAELLELALKHGFVTDVTSLVLLLDQRAPCIDWCDPCPVCAMEMDGDAAWSGGTLGGGRGTGQAGGAAAPPATSNPTATMTTTSTAAPTATSQPTPTSAPRDEGTSKWLPYDVSQNPPPSEPVEDANQDTPNPVWLVAVSLAAALAIVRRRQQ